MENILSSNAFIASRNRPIIQSEMLSITLSTIIFHSLALAPDYLSGNHRNQNFSYNHNTYSGSNTLSQVGWTSSDGGIHAVKQKQPNELGIYDMSGNVYEWVYDMAAPYTTQPQTDPCNTSGSQYIKRGGSFYYNDAYRFTSTYRYFYTSTDYTIGTRISLR